MKYVMVCFLCLLCFGGCTTNTKNLTFNSNNSKKLRLTFECNVTFDDLRLVRTYEEKNTIKNVYYVDFDNIYESYFELTQTSNTNANFSKEAYIQHIQKSGAKLYYQETINGLLYLSFLTANKQLNQIVHARGTHLSIVNAEPLMFNALKSYCKNK